MPGSLSQVGDRWPILGGNSFRFLTHLHSLECQLVHRQQGVEISLKFKIDGKLHLQIPFAISVVSLTNAMVTSRRELPAFVSID